MTAARPAPIRSRRRLRRLACSPPEPVADGVWLLRGGLTRTMNVFLLRDEQAGGVVVFDAGEKGMAGPIAAAASALGGMSRVVLGHGDTDHRGAAPALRALAEVQCHPDAVGQAQGSGGRDYWRMEELPRDVRLLHGFAHRFVWDGGLRPCRSTSTTSTRRRRARPCASSPTCDRRPSGAATAARSPARTSSSSSSAPLRTLSRGRRNRPRQTAKRQPAKG